MESDIVVRLRILWTSCTDRINNERTEAAAEIERLRKERDEARRMYLVSTCSEDEIIHEMKRYGWNCFRENTDGQ